MSEEGKWEQLLQRLKDEKEEALTAFREIRQEIKDEARVELLSERIEKVEQKQDETDLRIEELHAMLVNATGW